jgi:hypothetical protein
LNQSIELYRVGGDACIKVGFGVGDFHLTASKPTGQLNVHDPLENVIIERLSIFSISPLTLLSSPTHTHKLRHLRKLHPILAGVSGNGRGALVSPSQTAIYVKCPTVHDI